MKDLGSILLLFRKEFLLEFRTRSAISGIFLYVVSTLFVVYETFINIQPNVWNTLFWIILLFVAVNAMVKSFVQEKGTRVLYYYSLLNPTHVILAKIFYNTLLMLVLSFFIWGLFAFFGDNPVKDLGLFVLILFLGSFGFSVTFTFLASLGISGSQNSTLLAVLSFPLIIPIILMLVKISAQALRLVQDTSIWSDVVVLVAIDMLICGVALILFPFIWRD